MALPVLFFVLLFGYTYQQVSLVKGKHSYLLERKDVTTCVDNPACVLLPGICSSSDVAYIQATCPDKCGMCPTPVCSPSYCQNSGVCVMFLGNPNCACPDEVSGVHCETDTRDCPTNPCRNGGTCSRGKSGTFICSCAPGFTGLLCEIEVKTTTTTATTTVTTSTTEATTTTPMPTTTTPTTTTTSRPTPLDGGWGTWGSYGACSKTCGGGTQGRHRACDTPARAHHGKACVGTSTSSQTCQSGYCPVDGGWGTWVSYGHCSKTCGRGTQIRHRDCNTPSPAHGGKACVGDSISYPTCQSGSCPDSNCYIVDQEYLYVGHTNNTEHGVPCIKWSHAHNSEMSSLADFTDGETGYNSNFCRESPYLDVHNVHYEEHGRPWCYTGHHDHWGYCDIPVCSETQVIVG